MSMTQKQLYGQYLTTTNERKTANVEGSQVAKLPFVRKLMGNANLSLSYMGRVKIAAYIAVYR